MHASLSPEQQSASPFLISDAGALRQKIAGFDGVWKRRWLDFLSSAAAEHRTVRWYAGGPDKPLHAAFAWVATGERRWREISGRDLLWMLENYDGLLEVGCQDGDTWIHAAALARRAIALDWMWESGVLGEDERSALAELFITDSLKYPYVTMHHRVPAHANNQGLAQALNMVTVGYLFGHKLGTDPRAQHLLDFALPHLLQQIAWLPPDGYSGEGSTYIVLVADPLMALACAVMEAATGEDFFTREFAASGNSAEKVLRLNAKLIPPSGLLPAWDQHGYHLQKVGTTAAYLAHRTGDATFYQPYLFGDGWEFSGTFAWGNDDHVWQLLWMPDPAVFPPPRKIAACYPKSWAENRVAGALLDRQAALHLFQMWDISGPRPVRGHMNPNSLLLEAWGSLLTVDGNAAPEGFALEDDPRMQFMHWAMSPPKQISWAAGSLAAHSTIWIDGRIDHTSRFGGFRNLPEDTAAGYLLRLEDRPGLQLLGAEVAPFYENAFDVRSMIRTSALVDDAFWVVLDRLSAVSVHEWTWQLVLRAGAKSTPYGARLLTAEAVVLDVFSLDDAPHALHDIAGYPSTLERRCHHLRKSATGAEVEFLTVLIPQRARRELADWTLSWRGRADPEERGLSEHWERASGADWAPMELSDAYYERAAAWDGGNADRSGVWFTRECTFAPGEAETLLLELSRSYPLQLWIDGVEIQVPQLTPSHHPEPRLQPPFIDVTSRLAGRTRVKLTLRIARQRAFGLTGFVKLHAAIPVEMPRIERLANGDVRVAFGAIDTTVRLTELRTQPQPSPSTESVGDDPLEAAREIASKISPAEPDSELLWQGNATERQRACVLALRRPLAEVEEPLLACCGDEDWLMRLLAIRALGELRSARAVPVLRQILRAETPGRINAADYPPKYRLKEICIYALGRIGDPAAAPDLAAVLTKADFYGARRLAAETLGSLGDAEFIPALEAWIEDSDPETKAAAIRSLARLQRRSIAQAPA